MLNVMARTLCPGVDEWNSFTFVFIVALYPDHIVY